MKKFFLLFIVLIFSLILLVSGCSTNENDNSADANLLEQIKSEGELKIGTEGTYALFSFHDESGKLTGFDVEIAEEIANRLGVNPKFMETRWDGIFEGLNSERFDIIANQVGIRPDREEIYDFSKPYISSSMVLVVHKDNNDIKDFADIAGLRAAQTLTSNYADKAREVGAEIVGVEGFNQAIDLITSKRAEVTLNDKLSVLDFLKQKPDAPVKIVATSSDAAQSWIMLRKGNQELGDAINKALDEMMADGTYLDISKRWFGEDVSK